MIIDRSQRTWIVSTCGIAAASGVLYAVYAANTPNGARGGSAFGLAFGFAAAALIVSEALLSLRKKMPAFPLGRMSTWLSSHVWLGLLSFLLVLLHSGWHWGGGLAGLLMWLLAIVSASGMLGVVLQHTLPRRMTEQLPRETVYEQIPRLIRLLRQDADERVQFVTADLSLEDEEEEHDMTQSGSFRAGGKKFHFDTLQRISAKAKVEAEAARRKASPQIVVERQFSEALRLQYTKEIRPFLADRPSTATEGLFRNAAAVAAYFNHLRTFMPVALHVLLQDLEDIVEERRQLQIQSRMHLWLHGWLLVHVPLSAAVLLLIAIHAVMALRF